MEIAYLFTYKTTLINLLLKRSHPQIILRLSINRCRKIKGILPWGTQVYGTYSLTLNSIGIFEDDSTRQDKYDNYKQDEILLIDTGKARDRECTKMFDSSGES